MIPKNQQSSGAPSGTNDHPFQGKPGPRAFSEGNSRKRIAMYYYSNRRSEHQIASKIGTRYRVHHTGDPPTLECIRETGAGMFRAKPPR